MAWASAACPWTIFLSLASFIGCSPAPPSAPPPAPPAIVRPADSTVELSANERQSLDRLADLMRDRLLLMHDVARWKWNHDLPIEDRQREAELLDRLAAAGVEHDLPPERTSQFFAAQIEAGKLVQQADFDTWRAAGQGPFADVPDLAAVQRPRIDNVSGAMLAALADVQPLLDRAGVRETIRQRLADGLRGEGIGERVVDAAWADWTTDGR